MSRSRFFLLPLLALTLTTACVDHGRPIQATNTTPPTASAGATQHVTLPATVTLDGSGSSSADGGAITYAWTLTTVPTGSATTLTNPTSVSPTFTPDLPGTYVAQLIVSEGVLTSTAASVTVGVSGTVNLLVNGSFESGLSGWTTGLQLATGATGTGGYNGDTAPGVETLTGLAGLPATDGTQVALGGVISTNGTSPVVSSVLYQDVVLPAAAATATFSFDIGAKGTINGYNNGYKVGIYATTSVPGYSSAAFAGTTPVFRNASTADSALFSGISSSFNLASHAGETVRFAIINATQSNIEEVIVVDNVRFDVLLAY
jgi:hypothetical protein